jgi:hypothetical protein
MKSISQPFEMYDYYEIYVMHYFRINSLKGKICSNLMAFHLFFHFYFLSVSFFKCNLVQNALKLIK